MTSYVADASHQRAARVAGLASILFTMLGAMHFALIETHLIVSDNTVEIARFIIANETLFRIGIMHDLVIFIVGIILSLALYTLLKAVDKNLALLGLIMMLILANLSVVIELSSFVALQLVSSDGYLTGLGIEQRQALLGLILKVRPSGYSMAVLFFSLGMCVFSYLLFKSRYIPVVLSAWGMAALSIMFVSTAAKIVLPHYSAMIAMNKMVSLVGSVPVMLFQLAVGIWLLSKGVNTQTRANRG